jgi:hypothetical protein
MRKIVFSIPKSPKKFILSFRIHFSTKSIPELIKYCVDVDSNVNDDGISPNNICQACLEKLQVIHEFKWKCHESDKYLKQIINHSREEEPDITPYNPVGQLNESYPYMDDANGEDDDSLLQPIEYDYENMMAAQTQTQQRKPKALKNYPRGNRVELNGVELKKGQRHGDFVCGICNKTFRYVKPYKNHLKLHKNTSKPMSYYKRRKQFLTDLIGGPIKASEVTAKLSVAGPSSTKKFKAEPQAQYDSISPYNSPAPYEQDSVALHSNTRDSSPDLSEAMFNSSRHLLNGDEGDDEEDLLVEQEVGRPSRSGRKAISSEDRDFNPNERRTKPKPAIKRAIPPPLSIERRKPRSTISDNVVESPSPPKKPGPLSKTRGRPRKRVEEDDDDVQIEGFSTVDITQMLKRKRDLDFGE